MSVVQGDVLTAEQLDAELCKRMSEETWLQHVRRMANGLGRRVYHTRQVATCPRCHGPATCARGCRQGNGRPVRAIAQGSDAGIPDLLIPVPPILWVVELKRESGVLSDAQAECLELIDVCSRVEAAMWRPSDRAAVLEVLG